MNQTNLLQKFAPLGVAAFGAISVIGIATAPAHAAVIGAAGFDAEGILNEVGNTTTLSDIFNFADEEYSGIFSGLGTPNTPGSPQDNGPIFAPNTYRIVEVKDLVLTTANGTDYTNGFIDDFKVYENSNGDQITFDLNPGFDWFRSTVGDEIIYSNIGGYEGNYTADDASINDLLVTLDPNGFGAFQFSDSGTLEFAEIEVTQDAQANGNTVPEPTTILGLLTFGGLGFGLKRKKQL